MIRPGSHRHFLVVSDDNADDSAADFIGWMTSSIDPPIPEFKFHAITASVGPVEAVMTSFCVAFSVPLTANKGVVYEELVALTSGVYGDLCLQDFAPVFDELATVVTDVSIACEWVIPDPPDEMEFVADEVNVNFTDGDDVEHLIPYVESPEECDLVEHGWYYDDPLAPTTIILCLQTCDWVQGQEDASISIGFGCETVIAEPE